MTVGCASPGSAGPEPVAKDNTTFGYVLVIVLLTASLSAHLLIAYLIRVKHVDLRYVPGCFLCNLCEAFCQQRNMRYSRVHKVHRHRGVEIPGMEDEEVKNIMVDDSLAVVVPEDGNS